MTTMKSIDYHREWPSNGITRSMTVLLHLLLLVVLLAVEREISALSTTIEVEYTTMTSSLSAEDSFGNRSSDSLVSTSLSNITISPITDYGNSTSVNISNGLPWSAFSSVATDTSSMTSFPTTSLSSNNLTSTASFTSSSLPGFDNTTTSRVSTQALKPTGTSSSSSPTTMTSSRNTTVIFLIGTSTTTATIWSDSLMPDLAIGLGAGGGALLIIIIIIITVCVFKCCKKSARRRGKTTSNGYSSDLEKQRPSSKKKTKNPNLDDDQRVGVDNIRLSRVEVEKADQDKYRKIRRQKQRGYENQLTLAYSNSSVSTKPQQLNGKTKNRQPSSFGLANSETPANTRRELMKSASVPVVSGADQDKYRKIRRKKQSGYENQLTLAYADNIESAGSTTEPQQLNGKTKKGQTKAGPSGLANSRTPVNTRSELMESVSVPVVSGADPLDDEPFPPPPAIGFVNSALHQFVEPTLQPVRMHPSAAWRLSGVESQTDPH